MKITISSATEKMVLELDNNPTAKSLYDQLPLEVDMEDYAGIEKIFYPPKKLSKDEAPSGYQANKGDITYYAPWGDVAIFYKDFSHASGLIPLGKITEGLGDLTKFKNTKVKIEKAN